MKSNTTDRLRQLMDDRHLKQVDILNMSLPFQKALGIKMGKSTLSQYVTGKQSPDQDRILLLAKTFDVSEPWLMGYDVSPDRKEKAERVEPLPIHSYPYIPAAISAGEPTTVDAITPDQLEQVAIPDAVMGKWAGHSDITLMRANGESMNRVIPNGSLIGVRSVDEPSDLKDGDIVVFDCNGEYAVKKFYNDKRNRTYVFQPDSNHDGFYPATYGYDDEALVAIVGKVVMYVVELS